MKHDILKSVPLFAGLPEDDLERLCRNAEETEVPAGKLLFAEGEVGDKAYVIVSGEIEVIKESVEREVLLAVLKAGQVVGEIALLEHQPRMASVRARSDTRLIGIRQEQLQHLLETSLPATRALFYTVLERWKSTEQSLRHGERMAQLGTMTAGVAHELNNPAAAVRRGADQLHGAVKRLLATQKELSAQGLSPQQWKEIAALEGRVQQMAGQPRRLDTLARSDREDELAGWLEGHGVAAGQEVAPGLVDLEYDVPALEGLTQRFEQRHLRGVMAWLIALNEVQSLLAEVGAGAGRISAIVKTLKSYSRLDEAPVQNVDVHGGIEDTLLILHHRLKQGVNVVRQYAADLPRITAYGSELNQVWTNIIDNAIDAIEGKGTITIRTRREGQWVIVELEDDGPGIPPGIQGRIFDSFFTTKPPGKGTGMGLNITYNIVVLKHRGDIRVRSEPGKTCFEVWLPLDFKALGPRQQ